MEDFSKYIGAIIILGITIYRAFSNYKAQQEGKKVQPHSEVQDEFEPDAFDSFEIEEEKINIQPISSQFSKPKERFTYSNRRDEKMIIQEEDEYDENELSEIIEDFDARKAFIYSEILKPPYL